jgi:beta-galactosidase
MRGWGKGNVWVNGHNLGRYWHIGPQQSLFVPAPWLKKGRNEVIVLDLLEASPRSLQGRKEAVWGSEKA